MIVLPAFPDGDRVSSLCVLDFGLFRVWGRDGTGERVIGIPGYLVTTVQGRHVLIDTGFPPEYAVDPAAAVARDGLGGFGRVERLTPDNLPGGQLARLGLTVGDIDAVVLTHSDVDHWGSVHRFDRAPVVVAAADRALPHPRHAGAAGPQRPWPDLDWRPVEGDADLLAGFTILSTPGHAPGHLSVMLDLPDAGCVILTADAVSRPAEIAEGFATAWDPALAAASAARLMDLARDRGAAVVWGHCPDQWPRLPRAPQAWRPDSPSPPG
jgi:N-acyl homoserine lactone hydrolase